MSKKSVQIRLSQFITTYGVGSLVEIPDAGPCIVLGFEHSGLFTGGKEPNDFLFSNFGTSRLSKRLLYRAPNSHICQKDKHERIGIFELPSNASYDRNILDNKIIYSLKRFPNFALCEHEVHQPYGILHFRFLKCPVCRYRRENIGYDESNRNTVRFVSICPNGHLSDVNWQYHVHKKGDLSCKPVYFLWHTIGTGEVRITCPDCKHFTSLKEIIRLGDFCQSFWPEEVKNKGIKPLVEYRNAGKHKCEKKTQVIPRNSMSAFVPEVITAISTPLEANEFYKILNYNQVANLLKKHASDNPPKSPPDVSAIEQVLNNLITELKQEIRNLKKMLLTSRDEASQQNIKELLKKKTTEAKKVSTYINIIEERYQDNVQVKKINALIEDFYISFLLTPGGITEEEFRKEELNVFLGKSKYLDYPDVNRTLIVDKQNAKKISFKTLKFEVTPIPKLEVVMVQQGYKRIVYKEKDPNPRVVPTPFIEKIEEDYYGNWYPSVRLSGEGVFIELLNLSELKLGPHTKCWEELFVLINKYIEIIGPEEEKEEQKEGEEDDNKGDEKKVKRNASMKAIRTITEDDKLINQMSCLNESLRLVKKKDENFYSNMASWLDKFKFRKLTGPFIHPIGIWWHTFSHRVIKAISADCGYSLASIRERIYIVEEEDGIKAGLLIYSARPGMDGTMGGLVYLIPRFKKIIERALQNIDMCSNDPICGTNNLRLGQLNGAACYACLFLPETSCEFGNIGLDRNLLINSVK